MASASKIGFLEFPATQMCTTTLSFGPPKSGKTYLALECMKYWIEVGMFDHYYCVIPQFKNEQNDSYQWMNQYMDRITIYESFHDSHFEKVILEQEKYKDESKKNNDAIMRRIFVFVDDATTQQNLFQSITLIKLVTCNRHLCIHSWLCVHYAKGVIKPAVRLNINFVFVYPMKEQLIKAIYDDYIPSKWKEFAKFEQFMTFWAEYVESKKYGCLLIAGSEQYSPFCSSWFNKKMSKNNE
jgi:hypothetical protein